MRIKSIFYESHSTKRYTDSARFYQIFLLPEYNELLAISWQLFLWNKVLLSSSPAPVWYLFVFPQQAWPRDMGKITPCLGA
jgi:hypothetical protein